MVKSGVSYHHFLRKRQISLNFNNLFKSDVEVLAIHGFGLLIIGSSLNSFVLNCYQSKQTF